MKDLRTMRRGERSPATTQLLRAALALVCVLLVLVAGSAQLLHQHAVDEAQNPNCSLCVVAHLTVTVTPVTALLVQAKQVNYVPPAVLSTAPAKSFPFYLYVRPPPALTV